MECTAVFESFNSQSGVYSTALLCAPEFADAKPLNFFENAGIWGYKTASTPNGLNAWFSNYGKITFRCNVKGNLLGMKTSHQCIVKRKTILFANTPVSLSTRCLNGERRGP
jgi:hypothetical protein